MQQGSVLGRNSAKPIFVSEASLVQSRLFLRNMPRQTEEQDSLYPVRGPGWQGGK